ncbi:hypothetical protein A3742_04880 [Oleiphilus sp. HI0071]|uniref:MNIO family bufferin maturase n=1 Tax=unclassified Oleiphilus TaxID=2631174 RepID=UPI0007C2193C|nr:MULTISPECIES: DUF692 domain-containing protein [unclassified Oleiphilus]KZY63709.1 hypothetical protein A3737_03210 [Oleiphilus sp. HI0065]KZY86515.1 hypothetical protein A3742_04880 [Oleiphilus sp. HI0071]KZZ06071.1 hypothetical protein A3744_07275 [Oleiphilus sp. HI0073]KZZ51371.1 hypothetical protein A3760_12670 [Oleiphilus sp. HI0122]KZZ51557.1 hypothetical protein A3758_12135 [Oleiphilus sp. HI0118]KZZ70834.1 hypothetical protein A3765_15790 [Oleiphilus sp. HI0130]
MGSKVSDQKLEGLGLGLRAKHYQDILTSDSNPDSSSSISPEWFEALTDNYLGDGGMPLYYLGQIAERFPLSFHGVGLSLGSTDPLNEDYLQRLARLVKQFDPQLVSDHLCWSSASGIHGHDLFPMPYTELAARHIAERIQQVQERLGRQILIENVSSYLQFGESYLSEVEFLCEVVEQADCLLLCDLNNIYVSAKNHNFDAFDYLTRLPACRIRELHLAGFEDQGSHLLDTHGASVHDNVWTLYAAALARFGRVPTLIEWDTNIPEYSVLLDEMKKASVFWEAARDVA